MAKPYKPILCIDFDGVIHGYQSGWKGAHVIPDQPVPGSIDALLSYLDAGFEVAIFSSRSKSLRGRWAMKRWLGREIAAHWATGGRSKIYDAEVECWGDATGVTRRFSWPWFKPSALITIDDRSLTFNGRWADYDPKTLRAFLPWNTRLDLIDGPLMPFPQPRKGTKPNGRDPSSGLGAKHESPVAESDAPNHA